MQKSLDIEFEKAVRILAEHMPVSEESSRKPVLFHDIRVGVYLYEKNYSRDIVLAGLLHDALEWGSMPEDSIEKEFGSNVFKIVKACTKDRSIQNSDERIRELVNRCAEISQDALIVKAADTLDSFNYYTKENNQSELEYCRKNAQEVLKYTKNNYGEKVFENLERISKY